MIEVEDFDSLRLKLLISSLVFSFASVLVIQSEDKGCDGSKLEIGLWLCFGVQITTFILTLFHYIGLSHCLAKMGRLLGIYFFMVVGAMFGAQVVFFQSKDCLT